MERRFELDIGVGGTILTKADDEKFNTPDIAYLDAVEDSCWELFKQYSSIAGVEFDEDSDIDFTIVKSISEKIIAEVENTFNIKFPIRK